MKTLIALLIAASTIAAVAPANAGISSSNLATFDGPAFGPADVKTFDGPAFGPKDLQTFDGPKFGPSDVRSFEGPAQSWQAGGNQR